MNRFSLLWCGLFTLLVLAACSGQSTAVPAADPPQPTEPDTAVDQPVAEPVKETSSDAKPQLIEFYADW